MSWRRALSLIAERGPPGNCGIHFIFKKNRVAHYDRFIVRALCKRRPGSKSDEGWHLPTIDRDRDVIAWKGDFIDSFPFIELAFQSRELIDTGKVQIRGARSMETRERHNCCREIFDFCYEKAANYKMVPAPVGSGSAGRRARAPARSRARRC
jgi:hypothetical protein